MTLYVLNGPRYVYYLNGMEIANTGGIPSATLEYGQSWLPATDMVCLNAFTGVATMLVVVIALASVADALAARGTGPGRRTRPPTARSAPASIRPRA